MIPVLTDSPGDQPAPPGASRREAAGIVAGVLLSAGLLYAVSGGWLLPAVFVVGLALMGAIAHRALSGRSARQAMRPAALAGEFAPADWSVTRAAIADLDDAIAVTDPAGRLVCANSRFTEWFGAAMPPHLPLTAVDAPRVAQGGASALRDGQATIDAVTLGGGAGQARLVIERSGRGEDHLVWRFTRLRQHDPLSEAVFHVGGKFGRVFAREGLMVAVVSPDGTILAANSVLTQRALGSAQGDLVGTDFVGYFRSDPHEQIYFARETGQAAPVRFLHVPITDPDVMVATDPSRTPSLFLVLDQQGGLGEGRTGLSQIETLLARLPLGLAMTDREGRLLFANSAFLRTAGHAGPIPPYPSDLVIGEDKGALSDAVRRHAQGAPTKGDLAVRLRNSPDEPVQIGLAGVRGLGEAAVLLSLKDSTEEARLRREIAQASKMQAVGQLAGGVAHDFNNVLTAIIGYCDLMLMRHPAGDSDYDDIQQIKANSNRAASLTRQLLAFSRQQTLRPQVLQLPDVVAEVSTLLKRLLGEKITLEVSHDRDLGAVRADPVQLEQVLLNLAVNARDAMADNRVPGVLRLITRRVTAPEVMAMNIEFMPIGDYTALVVEDNGHGIPQQLLGKIFEPFFTTKDKGKGTGLGLATVYGIVKQSGGFIFAESEVGRGTRFSIFLPVHIADPAEIVAPKPVEARTPQWTKGGRVLLVEDEDTVRAVAERALVRQGYDVTTAADGEEGLEALDAAAAEGGGFDLVVSDVVMPSMDGPAMAREIRARQPDLPFLFMSGYAEETLRREIDMPNMHFLAKPFSVAQIVAAVELVLSGV